MNYPRTYDEILANLNTLYDQKYTYMTNPAKFAELYAGSIRVSIPQWMSWVDAEISKLEDRLRNVPYTIETDMEGTQ